MDNVIDITQHLDDRMWNEVVEDLLLSCKGDPAEILILLETYLVGKRKANGEF